MYNHNNKTKIPGTFIIFLMIVLVGFSGLTYTVTGKILDSGLNFNLTRIGFSNIIDILDKKDAKSQNDPTPESIMVIAEEIIASSALNQEYLNEPEVPEPTPIPTLTPTSVSTPSIDSGQTNSPQATSTPTPTSTLSPIAPTPTPSASSGPSATICSTPPLIYRVGYIEGIFYQHSFERDELERIVLYAESQWESAINADLFKYSSTDRNSNPINFNSDGSIFYDNREVGQFSSSKISDPDKNGLTDKFEINIFREIFYAINTGNLTYIGDPQRNYTITESIITRAVMHQMGHVLGINHLSSQTNGIMSSEWIPTLYKPILSNNDINQIKILCK